MDELVAIKGNGAVFHPLRALSKRNERCKKTGHKTYLHLK